MTTIKYIDEKDYQSTKNMAFQAVKLLADKVKTQKQELYVTREEITVLNKRLTEEKNKKQLNQFEKIGGNEDFGQLLAREIEEAMAPLTAEMEKMLKQKSSILRDE